jgi:hypothetical protein
MGLRKEERVHRNKKSFDEILGDPYALELLQGQFELLKNSTDAKNGQLQKGKGARPNIVDFFIDVEHAVIDGLKKYTGQEEIPKDIEQLFYNTYVLETEPIFTQQERAKVEQAIGSIFRKRSISPIGRYFTVIKQ